MSFTMVDAFVTQSSKGSHKLETIAGLVNWKRFGYRLDKILQRSDIGRTGYDPIKMFRICLLQRLYSLSDPEMEEMLYDRISFRRFCGFSLTDKLPDETTICRFRNALVNHTDTLLRLVNEDLSAHRISLKGGKIVDATVIQSSVRAPRGGDTSEKDPEAGWTKKRGEYVHGYKAHIACDSVHGLITATQTTSADIHDSQVFESLLDGDESFVMADKAYESASRRQWLMSQGIEDKLMYKGKRNKPQPRWQIELNKLYSPVRGRIERIFGYMKESMGYRRCRYKGWEKNQAHLDLMSIAYNLNRAVNIIPKLTG